MSAGGVSAAGFEQRVFASADLSGTPAWANKVVRVNFTIPSGHKPGGSSSPGFADVAANGWSADYTGTLLSYHTETHTLSYAVSGKFRLYGRTTPGSGAWTTLIDSWTASALRTLTTTVSLTAHVGYEIKIDWAGNDGQKDLRQKWSCPSSPTLTVIEPAFQIGDHYHYKPELYANFMTQGRGWAGTPDSNYVWNGDLSFVIQESLVISPLGVDPFQIGTCNGKFTGTCSSVSGTGNVRNFSAVTYDSGTNTSTFTCEVYDNHIGASFLNINGAVNVSNIELMKPGCSSGQLLDPRVTGPFTKAHTVYRNQQRQPMQTDWADNTRAAYPFQFLGSETTSAIAFYGGQTFADFNGPSPEHLCRLHNETGRDLMHSVPPFATDDYFLKLAQSFRYGTNGSVPYTSHQANPVYPPLNSNIRVYIEQANENWNTAAGYHANFEAIGYLANYHYNNATTLGVTLDSDYYVRRHQYLIARLLQISEIFRGVYGDEYGERCQFYYGFQYANSNNTASIPFNYARKLLEAGGLPAIGIPQRALKDFIQVVGGATYYSASNSEGVITRLSDIYGESPVVASGFSVRPVGSPNTYFGPAGIVHEGSIAINPPDGRTQVMFAAEGGGVTFPFTVPANQVSDGYSFGVVAVNRLSTLLRFTIILDRGTENEVDLFAGSQQQLTGMFRPPFKTTDWNSAILSSVNYTTYYSSKVARLVAGSSHTVTVLVEGTAGSDTIAADRPAILITEVRMNSLDAIADTMNLSTGQANGQPPETDVSESLNGIVRWVKPFGFEYLAYEGGNSLGGDTNGNPLQLAYKWSDPRQKVAQKDQHKRASYAGLKVQVWGTYAMEPQWSDTYGVNGWPIWETLPIGAAFIEDSLVLPELPRFDFTAPVALIVSSATTSDNTTNGFFSWIVCVREAGTYLITGANLGTGRLQLNGVDVVGGAAFLTVGQHGIMLAAGTGASPSSTATVTIKKAGVPTTAPAITGVSGTTVSWGADANATSGYAVRWGDETGRWYNRTVVSAGVTSATVPDIAQGTFLRMVVASVNANGEGLPGEEKAVTRYQSGVRRVATWYTGSDRASLPTLPSIQVDDSGVTVGNLVSDFSDDGNYGVFGAHVTGVMGSNVAAAASHAAAYAGGHKFRFTVTTPAAGFAPSQFLFSALAHVPAGDLTARVWVDGVAAYTSGPMTSNRNDITADLTGQGTWAGGVTKTIEITIAPLGGYYTAGVGHAPNVPAGLSFTGSVPSGFVPRRLLAAAGMM